MNRSTPLRRRTPLRARARARARTRWPEPLAGESCACGCGQRATHRHHIIDAQVCRRHGASTTDLRNGLPLATSCHMAHHNWTRRLERPDDDHPVHAFAQEAGLGWWLDRYYPASDNRVCGDPPSAA